MKTRLLIQSVTLCSLFLSCAEAPEYTPRQQAETSTASTNQSATKTPATSDAQKTAENKDTSTVTPEAPNATPTPTPTPTPSTTPAPNPTLGVAATGKTLVMQSCAVGCHLAGGTPGTPIDARNDVMLAAASTNPNHANRAVFFTRPAAGAPATSFTHVAAYLTKVKPGDIVRGPTVPDPQP
jgi:type III secretion protein P